MSNMYDQGGGGPDLKDQFRSEYTAQQGQIQSRKRSRSTWLVGIIGGALLLFLIIGGTACGTYNSLTSKQEGVRTAFSDVDVQLQRRSDLIPNLVETVKGYAKHEEKVFSDVANARARLLSSTTPNEKVEADQQLTGALGRLLVLQESYPQLKADQNFLRLQDQLEGTENRIQVARRDYNKVAQDYNTSRQQFPTVVVANMLGFERAEQFEADAGSRQAPNVKFP